ncbi:cytochrome P450, family 94, subfamily B, polypeptide 2 [Actinidia rufa]|uniref:Cytochrome P450, family 94, subfamily B, polypeptide 2 n=1 Tax=Actinidia rufa TaxID=165716 RepID=A0A7J0ELR7_9ERIC|nr:cytochrome P450, family 94, subfamily B, polypeptide 2 [Actinidia rufa]
MGLLILSLFFSLCFFLVIVISSILRRHPKFSGHGPPTYPVIGCLVSFYKNSHRLLDWYTLLLSESATQTIAIRRLGARRTVVTANPKNVEYMLKTNFLNYPKGTAFTEILGDFLGCGIFNVDGELWHTQRKLASHEFSAKSLQDYVVNTLVEEVENKLFPKMESLAMEGETVDLQELLRGFAFNIVCRVSLGIDPCNLDPYLSVSSLARAFNVASEMCAKRSLEPVFVIWKIKRMIGVGSERRLREAIEEIHAFVTKIIHDKKEAMGKDGVIMGEDLLTKMILAGHDEKFLRDMKQEVMKELSFVEDEKLSHYEELKEMNFLKACICESMRLFPPVAWDSKHAIADDLLPDGTVVRGGDRVTYFPYGMGRMKALWGEDRFEFKPERWFLEPDQEGRGGLKKVCPYKFPVFQAGPRVCLGKEMAFVQMKYVVASILKRFEIRPSCSKSPVFVPMLTAHMASGFKVFVRRR